MADTARITVRSSPGIGMAVPASGRAERERQMDPRPDPVRRIDGPAPPPPRRTVPTIDAVPRRLPAGLLDGVQDPVEGDDASLALLDELAHLRSTFKTYLRTERG